jgi:hypothetical protein
VKFRAAVTLLLIGWLSTAGLAQFAFEAFDLDHAAVSYRLTPPADPAAVLNGEIRAGVRQLSFEGRSGYLRSLLRALDIPVESQIVVYSTTSLQGSRIRPDNPRAIYFNDSVAVAWVRGGFIEVAAHDPRQGGMFYLLPQQVAPVPQLLRDNRCLGCHYSVAALGVPGFLVRSIPTAINGAPMPWLGNATPDHRTPLHERWGGWYVTGLTGSRAHLGNLLIQNAGAQELPSTAGTAALMSLEGRFATSDYLSPFSDVAALLVFDHQMRMMNLLTRLGWEARLLGHEGRETAPAFEALAREVVDYLLFVDEAPLGGARASSSFPEVFASRGPRDRAGRSLRDLDLTRRLMRYPCSYMIYSPAFDALPARVKQTIYRRLADVLSGKDPAPKYASLTGADRQAIVEILRDTKKDLPSGF